MSSFFKKHYPSIFIFFFSFFSMSFFLTLLDGDVLWNYGFSYAIAKGETPYLDFNMILTPLYPFLNSLLLLFCNNILIVYLFHSILIACLFEILFPIYGKNTWLFFLLLVFPIPAIIFPSYNFLLLFLTILLIIFEKKKKNDYLIGFIVGLSFLTKQSVGIFLLLPSIFYDRDFVKIRKRMVGFLIPVGIFLLYLLITKSIYSFIDYCFLGLFDFSSKNSSLFSLPFWIGILFLLYLIYLWKKNSKKIEYFYMLMFSSIMIPLLDFPHIEYAFFLFSTILLKEKKERKGMVSSSILFTIVFVLSFFFFTRNLSKIEYPNHYSHLEYRLLTNDHGENLIRDHILEFLKKHQKNKVIIIARDAYFYKIASNQKIDSFDLNNKGNHGYHGEEKLLMKLHQLASGTYIIVDRGKNKHDQFNERIVDEVLECGIFQEKIGTYEIYLLS